MLKTLIVEDDNNKLRKIMQVLSAVPGFNVDQVDYVATVQDAKSHLRQTSYDLLILDIALPLRIDQEVREEAGLQLLDEVLRRDGYKVPTHIIGVTAFPILLAKAEQQFSLRLLTVVYYNPTSDDWGAPLQERTRHMIAAKAEQQAQPKEFQSRLAVVCALRSPELDAVLRIGWAWEQHHHPGDDTIYWRGEFEREGQHHVIFAAEAARMGMPAASVLAMKMICQFRPEYLAMTGISAGVPGRTKFGDILAADPAFDWGSGKWVTDAGRVAFQPAPHQLALSPALRNKLKTMAADNVILAKIRTSWPGDLPDHTLSLRVGPVASGASVLADGSTASDILNRQRDLIGIEMETYGLFLAAEEAPAPKPAVFSLKSVVDFGDGVKNNLHQKYAAHTSAQALKYFLESYL